MKKFILIPIILGSILLTVGGVVLAVAISKGVTNAQTPLIENKHELEEEFTNFDVDLKTSDLEFKVASDDKKVVVCKETEKEYHTVKVENNTLIIKQIDEKKWYENIMNFHFESMKVTIYLPKGEYQTLKAVGHTGSINIPSDFSFIDVDAKLSTGSMLLESNVTNAINANVSTGSIRINNVTTKNIVANSSTGSIILSNINAEEKVYAKASTGSVTLDNVRVKDVETYASTGRIYLKNTIASNHIEVKTSTGDVKLEDVDADSLNIKTDTGDVKGTLLTGKTFDVDSDTGKRKVPDSTIGAGLCKIRTDTGDIIITVKNA